MTTKSDLLRAAKEGKASTEVAFRMISFREQLLRSFVIEHSDRWQRMIELIEKMPGWQPISTAPKDGTPILAFMPAYYQGKGGQHVVIWMDYSDRPGWYSHIVGVHEPTHWMPLPMPPIPDQGDQR